MQAHQGKAKAPSETVLRNNIQNSGELESSYAKKMNAELVELERSRSRSDSYNRSMSMTPNGQTGQVESKLSSTNAVQAQMYHLL